MTYQIAIDTSPAPVDPLTSAAVDVPGMSLTVPYLGQPLKFRARLPWLKSSVDNNGAALYLTNAADGKRQCGETVPIPLKDKNFTLALEAPALSALRNASGIWVPMEIGLSYTLKLQWAFAVSAKLTVVWAPGSEFFGWFEAS